MQMSLLPSGSLQEGGAGDGHSCQPHLDAKVVWQVSLATPSRSPKDEKVFGISMGLWRSARSAGWSPTR